MNYLLDLQSFLPGIIVAVAGLAAIMLEAFKKSANTSFSVTIGGIAVALLFAIQSLYG